jgi:hypothetical protein
VVPLLMVQSLARSQIRSRKRPPAPSHCL